jgi:V-type H+-transporting ATPase subunit B
MPDVIDPRMMSVQPRIRYNTIGGINGPLVVLDNVRSLVSHEPKSRKLIVAVDRSSSPGTTRLCP